MCKLIPGTHTLQACPGRSGSRRCSTPRSLPATSMHQLCALYTLVPLQAHPQQHAASCPLGCSQASQAPPTPVIGGGPARLQCCVQMFMFSVPEWREFQYRTRPVQPEQLPTYTSLSWQAASSGLGYCLGRGGSRAQHTAGAHRPGSSGRGSCPCRSKPPLLCC